MFKAPLSVKRDTTQSTTQSTTLITNSLHSPPASKLIPLKVRESKPTTPRPKWNQQSIHSTARPSSSSSTLNSSPITPHPRLLVDKVVNQLRGTSTLTQVTKLSNSTTTKLTFKQKLMMVNDENNPMNSKDDLTDKQTIQKLSEECLRLQSVIDSQASEIELLKANAKAKKESDDITEKMNNLVV